MERVDSEDSDSETSGRILEVSHLDTKSALATVLVRGLHKPGDAKPIELVTDTGVSKTLINIVEWKRIQQQSGQIVKTSKRFRRLRHSRQSAHSLQYGSETGVTCPRQ